MPANAYYRDELSYLEDLGSEFAAKYPAVAPFLGKRSADPDVERLLQGFAFLGGRIRQKLDDEFPEIINSLLSVLAPQFLQPFPSGSIVEFQPIPNRMMKSQHVAKGIVLQSDPIEGISCSFRTCAEFEAHPLSLTEASIGASGTRLALKFEVMGGLPLSRLGLGRLRIYLVGETNFDLFRWLSASVQQCRVVSPGAALPKPVPGGFEPENALVPFPPTAFQGYRLLQEYLVFPEKFLFIDFRGLDLLNGSSSSSFEIECEFSQEVPRSWRLSKDNFRLNCVPVVNLFDLESNPVDVTHERREYRLTPPTSEAQIFSVTGATAWISGTAQMRRYEPFLSLEKDRQITYFGVQTKVGIDEESRNTYVSLTPLETDSVPPARETAVFNLVCTNGTQASKLTAGEIHRPSDNSPDYATFRNVSRVSAYLPANSEPDRAWRLLSNLVLSPTTLKDVGALRSVFGLYNFPENVDGRMSRANSKRIEGITSLQTEPVNFVITPELDPDKQFKRRYGLPLRGSAVNLRVEGSNFSDEGDLYLFGAVLNRFFSQYATLNSLTQLRLINTSSGAEYSWSPRFGEQIEF